MSSFDDDSRTTWRFAAAGALLALALGLAYLPLGQNSFVNFDDDRLILDNPALRDLSGDGLGRLLGLQLFTPHYKPLVNLSWAAELRLFGAEPRVFHRHNLLLHLLNALLVLGLVSLLTPDRLSWRQRIGWGMAAAALWALHPMKVESVAWASERKDVLFAAFYLGSLLSYLRYVDRRGRRWLAASALLALGGVLSKSAAITLPLALPLIDLLRHRRWCRALLVEKLPHLAVLVMALYLYGLLPGPGAAGEALDLIASANPVNRLATAAQRHLAFAWHWLTPFDLAVLYPVPESLGRAGWGRLAAGAGAHLALLAGLAAALRRNRRVAAALLFYSLTLLPTLVAPISITNYLSDRYTYLPSLGLTALVLLAAAIVGERLPRGRPALAAVGAVTLVALAALTYRQIAVWRDSESLWNHTLTVQGPHPYAHNNRGVARLARGDRTGARDDFDAAILLDPGYAAALANRADLLRRNGFPAQALADLEAAIASEPWNPALHRARGDARADLDRPTAAIADYDRALELDAADLEALYARARARRRVGDLDGARADIERLLAASRPTAAGHLLHALVLAAQGEIEAAVENTSAALALDPDNAVALNNRGFLHLRLGDPVAALRDLDIALALRPGYALAHRSRGDALATLGDLPAACLAWRRAALGGAPATNRRLADCPAPHD